MGHSILGNSSKEGRAREFTVFQITMFTWASGKMIGSMVMVFTFMPMAKDIKENFQMDERMAEELIIMVLEQFMKENGKETRKMDLEFTHIPMDKNMRVIG